MDGFSYRGIHCSRYNVEFIPDAKARWFQSPGFDVYQDDVSGRDGGYYYGNNVKIRKFTLNCYFEEITRETREEIRNWLDRNTKGRLVFDERPFVYYNVYPTDITTGDIYAVLTPHGEVYSGTFTATFSAYEPYGTLLYQTLTDDAEMEGAAAITGLIYADEMPAAPTTDSRSFLMYNPGTQPCNTTIRIGGSGTNITIANHTNGTACKLLGLPTTGYLEIDSKLGKVVWVNGNDRTTYFAYHNEGYMTLAPYLPRIFQADASYTSGSDTVTFYAFTPTEDIIGKYIRLSGGWRKIIAVSETEGTAQLESNMTESGAEVTKIVTMNEITIAGTALELNKLEILNAPLIV